MTWVEKPLVWLLEKIKTPPFSREARLEAGYLLRCLQEGEKLSMPHSRPMPSVGGRCHELRVKDVNKAWRIVYRIDQDAILILDIFEKKTSKTPKNCIETCKSRMKQYDEVTKG